MKALLKGRSSIDRMPSKNGKHMQMLPYNDPVLRVLRSIRRSRGLVIKEVARLMEPPASDSAVGRVERGLTMLTMAHLRQFSRIYGVQMSSILLAAESGRWDEENTSS